MSDDPGRESARWLAQAEEELADAAELLKRRRFYLSLYLCQQSAEKALKAFVYMKEEEPVFSHSVGHLLKLAASIDADFKALSGAKRLDDYYIPTRYPNGLPGGIPAKYYDDPKEAKEALNWSSKVVRLCARKIRRK
ncbi:MAG: HEPN domain-containing protein [bacterium]